MATADDESKALWNEFCEDVECDDTNYHATVEELMQRITDNSNEIHVLNEAEDIVLQAELTNNEENE